MSRKHAEVPGLDELFKGRQAPGNQETTTEEVGRLQEVKTSKHQEVKTSKPEQVTVYLYPETINLIETARLQLRIEKGIKATKSAIIEACVRLVVQDLARLKEQIGD
jgi:hypothetical protein